MCVRSPLVHAVTASLPLVSCACFVFLHPYGGPGSVGRGSRPTKIPSPTRCKRRLLHSPWVPAWTTGECIILSFHLQLMSCCSIAGVLCNGAETYPLKNRFVDLFCMLFPVSGTLWYQTFVSCHFDHLHHHFHPPGPPVAEEV